RLVAPDLGIEFVALAAHKGSYQPKPLVTAKFKRRPERQERENDRTECSDSRKTPKIPQPAHLRLFENGPGKGQEQSWIGYWRRSADIPVRSNLRTASG